MKFTCQNRQYCLCTKQRRNDKIIKNKLTYSGYVNFRRIVMKKKLLVVAFAAMAVGLVGCGDKKEEATTAATTEAVTTEATTTEAPVAEIDYTQLKKEDVLALETAAPSLSSNDLKAWHDKGFDVYEKTIGEVIDSFDGVLPSEITYFGDETSDDLMAKWISTEDSAVYITVFIKPHDDGFYFARSSSASNLPE